MFAVMIPTTIHPAARSKRDNHGLKLNRLASLGSAMGFADLSALRELELSNNLLRELPDGIFRSMSRLGCSGWPGIG